MNTLPSNFPYGKNIWIWQLWQCVGKNSPADVTPDDYQKVIKKLKDNDISIALIKSGDGVNTWEDQLKPELIKAFHDAGLKIFSWSYVYGVNPEREAAIAMWSLDMGVDGHVFDAEAEYKRVPNPAAAATTMLEKVRAYAPTALLGHSPLPIIDYHQAFPYIEFGKYCDFVMPQVYFGEWGQTPTQGMNRVFQQWKKWQDMWTVNGHTDSVKPLIPVHQTFDWVSTVKGVPDYVVTPEAIKEFVEICKGYMAVSFYEYAHIFRNDCWNAIKESQLSKPDIAHTPEMAPVEEKPAETVPVVETVTTEQATPTEEVVMETPVVMPDNMTINNVTVTDSAGNDSVFPQAVDIPSKDVSSQTTITVKRNPNTPDGVEIKIMHHTPHALIVKGFILSVVHAVQQFTKRFHLKGGESKNV